MNLSSALRLALPEAEYAQYKAVQHAVPVVASIVHAFLLGRCTPCNRLAYGVQQCVAERCETWLCTKHTNGLCLKHQDWSPCTTCGKYNANLRRCSRLPRTHLHCPACISRHCADPDCKLCPLCYRGAYTHIGCKHCSDMSFCAKHRPETAGEGCKQCGRQPCCTDLLVLLDDSMICTHCVGVGLLRGVKRRLNSTV